MTIYIRDRKRLNTETATLVGEASHSYRSDFNYWEEELYRTPKGTFFIVGEGGALSRYRESCGQNSWGPGENVRIISKEAAYSWAEAHVSEDKVEEFFSDMIEEG